MSYKSLYRKYRPSKFEDVCGQEYIVTTLMNAIKQDKIGHAYLFSGTRGTGKTTIAKIFAKMVNCINKVNNEPCGKCDICVCENTDEIPDIIEIDAASNNGVDEIRELKNKIKLMPVSCKYKVYIIDEVHMLSTGAFNALLKTLEEPPEHVIFILATTEPQKLPITIISRCQRFDFKKISEKDIVDRLKYISKKEKIVVTEESLIEIARISGGAMRDAIGLLDQLSSYSEKISIEDIYDLKGSIPSEMLFELVNYYIDNNIDLMLDLIDKIYNNGKNFSLLVEDMLILFRNVLICQKAQNYFEKKDISYKEKILEMSKKISNEEIENIISKLENLSKNIKDSNYARILFEVCLLSDFTNNLELVKENVEKKNIVKSIEKEKDNNELVNKEFVTEQITDKIIEMPKTINNKDIMINNTIVLASNTYKKNVKDGLLNLDKYLIDSKYRNSATILKDATVVAASNDHILLTYKYESMVEENDNEIVNITKLFSDLLNTPYKVVAITESIWKEERPKYLELKKQNKLEFIKEKEEENKINIKVENVNIDGYADIFGNELIEMEG